MYCPPLTGRDLLLDVLWERHDLTTARLQSRTILSWTSKTGEFGKQTVLMHFVKFID
ncbi:hypothetical protein KL86CLO1_10091 [uncultured Eubacteriales bacterium]|uniref:Uncharacterized protein n=1 Tax=uncultured Eubacteriales bacterium TaxID=172733 RepID=A0A212IWC1_9FIRM|nr:hypothetical protein KL86CLO1_10091 [uncultured Eubacteriales bacterium]